MSEDYTRGWQDGWRAAAKAVWRNRNHNRALSGFAPETQAEAMKRISASWPAAPPARLPNAPPQSGTVVDGAINTMYDAIDLYVVLPDPNNFEGFIVPIPGPNAE